MPSELSEEIMSSFYADDTSYTASDTTHKSRTVFAGTHLQRILIELEFFCTKWRIKLNPDKTCCVNYHINKSNDNTPRLSKILDRIKTLSKKFIGQKQE